MAAILCGTLACYAYVSGAVAAILCGILAWRWGVTTVRLLRRRKLPAGTSEELRELALQPINDTPPRCHSCKRMFIWPDNEPVPPKQLCMDCMYRSRNQLFSLAAWFIIAALIAWVISR